MVAFPFASRLLSRFSAGPLEQHLDGAKHVYGYLRHCTSFALPVHHGAIPPDEASPVDVKDSLGGIRLFKQLYPEAKEMIAANNPTPCYDELPMLTPTGLATSPIGGQLQDTFYILAKLLSLGIVRLSLWWRPVLTPLSLSP